MADYTQTHVVPSEGLPAWAGPDGSGTPAANLDPGLDVMVLERRGDWAHIRCSNGWEAWVDGRRLIASPAPAAAPTAPPPPPRQAPPPPPVQQAAPPPPQAAPPPPPSTQPVAQAAPPTQPGPPSAVWGAPTAAPAVPRAAGAFRIGPGQIVALVGGLLFFISGWFTWLRLEFKFGGESFSQSASAYKVQAYYLLDSQSDQGGLNLGIVLAFLGVALVACALISAWNRRLGILSVAVGVIGFIIVVLFFVQTRYAVNAFNADVPDAAEVGYFSVLRYGVYMALVGAIVSVVGGILAFARKRS